MAKLIVLCGPSGVGKRTVWTDVVKKKKYNIVFSVSMTTRKKRFGEKNRKDYFFVTKQEFEQAIKDKKMLEWANYVGNFYGTPRAFIEKQLKKNKNVFLEIEMQGAIQVINNFPKEKLLTIFLAPPNIEELRRRLINRHTENMDTIEKRLKQAEWELTKTDYFQHVIINKDVEESQNELSKIFDEELK